MKHIKQFNQITEAVGVPKGISNITNNLFDSIIQKLSSNEVSFSSKKGDPRKYKYKTRELDLDFKFPLKGNINDYEVEKFIININITEVKRPVPDEPEISGAYFSPNVKLDINNFKILYDNSKKVKIGIRLEFNWNKDADIEVWKEDTKNLLLKNKSVVLSSLAHELMHSYDLAFIKAGKKFEDTAEYGSSGNLNFGIPIVDKFFFYLYFMQKCEIIVKSVEVAIKMEAQGVTQENFLDFLKKENAWITLKDISKWSYNSFHQELIDNVELVKKKLKQNDISTEGMTPNVTASYMEHIILNHLSNSKVDIIKTLLQESYDDILKTVDDDDIDEYYNDFIDKVKKDLKNPKNFFVKREKMFKFESEKLMRKISKLFSMAPDTKSSKLHTNISNKDIKTESILNWEKYQYAIGVNSKISQSFDWNNWKSK